MAALAACVSPLADGWGFRPREGMVAGRCAALSGLARTAGVRSGVFPLWRGRPLVYRIGLALVRGGSGLSLWFEFGSQVCLLFAFPLRSDPGFETTAARRGFSARCHSLLSGIRDELRKPAQHKNGFPSRKEGNPVERANSRNRPGWPGGASSWSNSLQR